MYGYVTKEHNERGISKEQENLSNQNSAEGISSNNYQYNPIVNYLDYY